MQSSASSASQKTTDITPPSNPLLARYGVLLLRLVIGCVFIFSGFVKAVDPWGNLYKFIDYFSAWNIGATQEVCLLLGCALSTFEFLLGVMIVLGCYRRTTAWAAFVFMAYMTGFTLYIWIADPVSDCGCFGDAIKMSNAMTFWKNVVLVTLCFFFLKSNSKIAPLIHPKLQWLTLVFTLVFIMAVQAYGYNVQPLIDFRPYPTGTDLYENFNGEGNEDVLFVYEKDGVEQSFTADNLPDDTWNFVKRAEDTDAAKEISIFDIYGDEVTADIIENTGRQYILIVNEPERYGISRSEMANNVYKYAIDNDEDMFAVVALPPDSIGAWIENTGAEYSVYSAEDTDLKMLARGEAALISLDKGIIRWKTNVFALPPEFPYGKISVSTLDAEQNEYPLVKFIVLWIISLILVYALSRIMTSLRRKKETSQPILHD